MRELIIEAFVVLGLLDLPIRASSLFLFSLELNFDTIGITSTTLSVEVAKIVSY